MIKLLASWWWQALGALLLGGFLLNMFHILIEAATHLGRARRQAVVCQPVAISPCQ